jgi:hypothetical protein
MPLLRFDGYNNLSTIWLGAPFSPAILSLFLVTISLCLRGEVIDLKGKRIINQGYSSSPSLLMQLQIIRYSFFGFKEAFGFAPSWLLWLRYKV